MSISTFGSQMEEQSAKDKYFFLGQPTEWQVVGNAPLTDLVVLFKLLCRELCQTRIARANQSPAARECYDAI